MTRENSVTKVMERCATVDATVIDRTLRRLAQQQSALDADEMRWLRIADAQRVWPQLGYVTALEYLEDVFGYAPRTALERMRVARELGELPRLEEALTVGELSYSAVRELSRVVTAETLDEWLEAAKGLRFRDVEQMVSGRKKGDGPDAKPEPALMRHRLVLELDGESLATWRQMRQVVELELGESLDDRHLVLVVGQRLLNGSVAGVSPDAAEDAAEKGNSSVSLSASSCSDAASPKSLLRRHEYLIHLVTCRDCGGAWQDGGGVRFAVDKSVVERAQCNAIVCDDERGKRAKRTIPMRIERQVLERAHHRCQMPRCRSSKHLTIHHIKFWSHGGDHDLSNLIVLCGGHHNLLHDGRIEIAGRAPDELVFIRDGVRLFRTDDVRDKAPKETHVIGRHTASRPKPQSFSAPALDDTNVSLARAALMQAGYKASSARQAVEAARARVGADVSLADLIKEALHYCLLSGL